MDKVLSGLKWNVCLAYLDDLVVSGKTFDEHCDELESVFIALEKANLALNLEKCAFAQNPIIYIGHEVNTEGIRPDPSKLFAITDFPSPNLSNPQQRLRTLRSFLGIVSYYRRFMDGFASLAAPAACFSKN